MCTGLPLAANLGLGAMGTLAGWANRDKLKTGVKKIGSGVGKATGKVANWADNTLKIN